MNENCQPAHGPAHPSHEQTSANGQPPAPATCVFAPIACALRQGAEDARRAAEKAAPKVKDALGKAAYHLAYGVAFAATFQYTVAKMICPEVVKAGARTGAREGTAAGERFNARFRREPTPASTSSAPAPPISPTGAEPEPGPA